MVQTIDRVEREEFLTLPFPKKKRKQKNQTGRRQVLPRAPLRPRLLRPGLQGHRRRGLPRPPRDPARRPILQVRSLGHGGTGAVFEPGAALLQGRRGGGGRVRRRGPGELREGEALGRGAAEERRARDR